VRYYHNILVNFCRKKKKVGFSEILKKWSRAPKEAITASKNKDWEDLLP
jgi:predicted GIY-YIG superfamily endonuclease